MNAKIIPAIKATPAVREYQESHALFQRRITEHPNVGGLKFWGAYHRKAAHEIADKYGMTVYDLYVAWEDWTESVEQARAAYAATLESK